MGYYLDCDGCEFSRKISDEIETYAVAKKHEKQHPDHFVFITQES